MFALTATPKPTTLRMFDKLNKYGNHEAFHLYSMKQAIEEVFKNLPKHSGDFHIISLNFKIFVKSEYFDKHLLAKFPSKGRYDPRDLEVRVHRHQVQIFVQDP